MIANSNSRTIVISSFPNDLEVVIVFFSLEKGGCNNFRVQGSAARLYSCIYRCDGDALTAVGILGGLDFLCGPCFGTACDPAVVLGYDVGLCCAPALEDRSLGFAARGNW